MDSSNAFVGPFEVLEWPTASGRLGRARHSVTLETVSIKTGWPAHLAREVRILQALAGGIGIPFLHRIETVHGKELMVVDSYGPTLEELFSQSGRHFSMHTLLLLADQMLSRVELIHSKNIFHGQLSPLSFALGASEWQNQQVLLVDFNIKTDPEPSACDDLQAVGCILSYLYDKGLCWEQYQQEQDSGSTWPALDIFGTAVSSRAAVDYKLLRGIFRAAYHDLYPDPALRIFPMMGALAKMETPILFDCLSSNLSAIGKMCDSPQMPFPSCMWAKLLTKFDKVLQMYMILLIRDRPSPQKEKHVMGAYHLPNRLWRDLYWFIKRINKASEALRYTVIGRIYRFLTALHDAVPSYRIYWIEYLLIVSRMKRNQESSCGKSAWDLTAVFWQDALNGLKAKSSVFKQLKTETTCTMRLTNSRSWGPGLN